MGYHLSSSGEETNKDPKEFIITVDKLAGVCVYIVVALSLSACYIFFSRCASVLSLKYFAKKMAASLVSWLLTPI